MYDIKLLIVEDDTVIRGIYQRVLEKSISTIILATNGDFCFILKNLKLNLFLQYYIRTRGGDMSQCACLLVHLTNSLERTQLFFRSALTIFHSRERKTLQLVFSISI
jgi:hypothetical protein